jgi:hypothetical protein
MVHRERHRHRGEHLFDPLPPDPLRFWEYSLIYYFGRRIAHFFVENAGITLLW